MEAFKRLPLSTLQNKMPVVLNLRKTFLEKYKDKPLIVSYLSGEI